MTVPLLEIQSLSKQFGTGRTRQVVFQDFTVEIGEGGVVSFLGKSGVGKSTLMRILSGLDTEFEGVVRINGQRVAGPSEHVGLVFQDNRLLPWKRVWENVAFSLPDTITLAAKKKAAYGALEIVGLQHAASLWPRQLSGGMAKRAAIARALAAAPSVLILDEPFAGLDPTTRTIVSTYLTRLVDMGVSVVLVTHDVDDAIQQSNRLLVLAGSPATIAFDRLLTANERDPSTPAYLSARLALLRSLSK